MGSLSCDLRVEILNLSLAIFMQTCNGTRVCRRYKKLHESCRLASGKVRVHVRAGRLFTELRIYRRARFREFCPSLVFFLQIEAKNVLRIVSIDSLIDSVEVLVIR